MEFAELEREVQKLDAEGQRKLMGLLVALQIRHDATERAELTRRLNDTDPANWLPLEEVERRLGLEGKR